ncbi:MAG: hypothetical protein QF794_06330 [Candidatus Marinimicrobia bacterium]|jgi:hypothetical protein|nr:hypothetical protein [Candidatus Neomarinimicrobiota bacterium]
MKKILLLLILGLLAFMACEDKKDEISPLIGTWEISNLGEYANANCSGALDDTSWAFAQLFGLKITIVIKEDGTGTMTMIFGDEIEEAPLTWDDSKSQICIMGDCLSYKIDGDSFTIDQPVEAFCSDDNSEETNHDTQSTCEASGNTWDEASCSQMEFTKK